MLFVIIHLSIPEKGSKSITFVDRIELTFLVLLIHCTTRVISTSWSLKLSRLISFLSVVSIYEENFFHYIHLLRIIKLKTIIDIIWWKPITNSVQHTLEQEILLMDADISNFNNNIICRHRTRKLYFYLYFCP